MTKYILAGGLDRAHPEYWDHLRSEVNVKKPVHLLSCFFSQPKKDWQEKFNAFRPFFARAFGDDVVCELASVEDFLDQVTNCDVLYLHGGTTHRLRSVLAQYGDLKSLFSGKVVIGSSAGANYLSKLGYSPSLREPMKGAGLTDLNVIVHYGSTFVDHEALGPVDWNDVEQQVRDLLGDDEIITPLREGEFVVVENEDH